MKTQTAYPFEEQVVFPEKKNIPELVARKGLPNQQVFDFIGSLFKASSTIVIDDKNVVSDVLVKPNCTCAISQSNKRHLETFGMPTDYVEPNQLLIKSLGFPLEECKQWVYAKKLKMFPLDFIVSGYDEHGDKSKLANPQVVCTCKTGLKISRDQAITVLAEWFNNNGYCFKEYKQLLGCEPHKHTTFYDVAAEYMNALDAFCEDIYSLLHKKYEAAGVLLVKTKLSIGFEEDNFCLAGEVGTPDTSVLASKSLYEKTGILESFDKMPLMKYLEKVAYNGGEGIEIPKVPDDVMIQLCDIYVYMATALSDEQMIQIYM